MVQEVPAWYAVKLMYCMPYGRLGKASCLQDERCNSIAFSDSGNMCVSAHNDGVLKLQRGDLDGSDPSADDACTEYLVEESGC